jgi:peptide/nickel transport system substrate-binding protein
MAKRERKENEGTLSRRDLLKAAAATGGLAAAGLLSPHSSRAAQPTTPAPAVQPQRGGQIIIGVSQETQNFNPLMPVTEPMRGVQMCIYDSLWRIDPDGNFIPNLAAEIPTQSNGGISRDGTAFTIKLRKDAKWHDGQPFTAKDVVGNWQTLMNPKVTAYSTVGLDQIESMTAADDFTVRFKLKQPYAPMLVILSDMFITPQHIVSKSPDINKDEFNTKRPVGTGPFKFVRWAPGDHIALEANKAYHGPGPYLDRLLVKYIPDMNVLFTQLKTGEIDMTGYQGIPVDLFPEAKTLPNIKVFATTTNLYEAVAQNFFLPIFQDKRVRQALYYGMDKKPIIEKIFLGLMIESETYIPPQSWAFNPKVKGAHKYDPEKAKQLLEQAGWKVGSDGIRVKDGKRLSFENACTAGNKQREQVQQLLQQQWRQIGVELTISNKPAAVLFGEFYRMSKFETILIGMLYASDPEHSFRQHSRYIPAKGGTGRNSNAYENPKVDQLLEAGVREMDREKRKPIYYELQEILVDDLPFLPIYHYVMPRGIKSNIQGYRPNTLMQDDSWNANEWWLQKA